MEYHGALYARGTQKQLLNCLETLARGRVPALPVYLADNLGDDVRRVHRSRSLLLDSKLQRRASILT